MTDLTTGSGAAGWLDCGHLPFDPVDLTGVSITNQYLSESRCFAAEFAIFTATGATDHVSHSEAFSELLLRERAGSAVKTLCGVIWGLIVPMAS